MTEAEAPPDKGTPPRLSVICVYNRAEVFERLLLPSVRSQTASYELLAVDNRDGRFRSGAAALNFAAASARGEYFVFVHQDVAFQDPDFLDKAATMMSALPNLGAAGVVGARQPPTPRGDRHVNAILHGDFPGKIYLGQPLLSPAPAQTVDELMIIVPAAAFGDQPFDERTCDGWHMYAVDYCLTASERGKSIYVLPLLVRHDSPGTMNASYFRALRRVIRKHRAHVSRIYTTCGPWSVQLPVALQRFGIVVRGPGKLFVRSILVKLHLWG